MKSHMRTYLPDVLSAVLYSGTFYALGPLIPFVAVKRLGASLSWVGVLTGGLFLGFLWNFFLSGTTARMSLRRGIVAAITVSALLFAVAAFQTQPVSYGIIVLFAMIMTGLVIVQYDTFLYHLYAPASRPKLLSWRALCVSIAAAAYAPIFGRITTGSGSHRASFLLAAGLLLVGAAVFRTIRTTAEHPMVPFRPAELLSTAFGDRRFRRMAFLLTLYGLFGVGIKTVQVVFYNQSGYSEFQVGVFSAIMTIGMILTNLLVTPFLRLRGYSTNFRLCFTAGAVSAALYAMAIAADDVSVRTAMVSIANFAYGVAAGGFGVASQTSVLNIATPASVSIFVNAFKAVQGIRGFLFPILVAGALSIVSLNTTMMTLLVVAVGCAAFVWIPRAEGSGSAS